MAYLNKEEYERRRESAARRMHENAKNAGLKPEQHDALANLCSVRHEIHSSKRIEEYLRGIDDKYGTNYCPTGAQRIF